MAQTQTSASRPVKAPRQRMIHRESMDSIDDGSENENLEEGMSFFDAFQETPPSSTKNGNSNVMNNDSIRTRELVINDAMAGALVGENVLDSPGAMRRTRDTSSNNNKSFNSQSSFNSSTSDRADNSEDSGGILTQGLAWIKSQREERRRKYLQYQAEQQAQKIREAQLAEMNHLDGNSNAHNISTLVENSTFQTLANMLPASTSGACGEDLSGVADQDTQEFDARVCGAGSGDLGDDDIIQKTAVSRSGDGYMVEFAVPDQHEDDMEWVPPVRIQESEENLKSAPYILTPEQRQMIAQRVLPTGIAYAKWRRLYSLARDGDSFEACLRLITGHSQTLLVLRTSTNDVLGGFADYSWDHPTVGGTQYFGGPTSCLFSFASLEADPKKDNSKAVRVYKWTGANRYIQLCDREHKMMAFGGGGDDGAFGLAVSQDFQHGSSGPCDTFGNLPLSSTSENFEVVDLEIYCFLLGQF